MAGVNWIAGDGAHATQVFRPGNKRPGVGALPLSYTGVNPAAGFEPATSRVQGEVTVVFTTGRDCHILCTFFFHSTLCPPVICQTFAVEPTRRVRLGARYLPVLWSEATSLSRELWSPAGPPPCTSSFGAKYLFSITTGEN